jgi:hypothetical protein
MASIMPAVFSFFAILFFIKNLIIAGLSDSLETILVFSLRLESSNEIF